jgi:hypothetical protein
MIANRTWALLPLLALASSSVCADSMRDWFIHREGGTLLPLIDSSVPPLTPAWTDNVDFASLRTSYAKRADFKQRCESRPNAEYFAATKAGNFGIAADLLEKWLRTCPIDALGHVWITGTYAKLSNLELKKEHALWFFGLTDVVLKGGGDGKTPQTAYEAISVSDEKAVLVRLGFPYFLSQKLTTTAPYVDEVTATKEDGKMARWEHSILTSDGCL